MPVSPAVSVVSAASGSSVELVGVVTVDDRIAANLAAAEARDDVQDLSSPSPKK